MSGVAEVSPFSLIWKWGVALIILTFCASPLRASSTTLGTTSLLEGPAALSDSVEIQTSGAWTATANASWLHTTSSGTGNGIATFTADANTGATRTGTLTVGGLTVTITQVGSTFAQAGVIGLVTSGLKYAGQIAIDGFGNVVIADVKDNAIKLWTVATPQMTTLVSSGLNHPFGVAVDGYGNMYIADSDNNAIKELSPGTQQVATLISSGLNRPMGLAVDGSGNLYIADYNNNAIKELNVKTQQVTTLISSGLYQPEGVAVDGAGNVYIADTGNTAVKVWNAVTQQVSTLVSSGLASPVGVAVDGSGNVYIADTGNNAIKEWSAATQQVTTLVSSGLISPQGVAVDRSGNVYISDSGNGAIKELPRAYVDVSAKLESCNVGSDPVAVLPSSQILTGVYSPQSTDTSWLTVGAGAGAPGEFVAFTANTGTSARTANVTVLGQTIAVTQSAPPTIDAIGDVSILENSTAQSVNLSGISAGDGSVSGKTIAVTATSNNQSVIPNGGILVSYTDPGTTGTVSLTPASGQYGTATITVTVQYNGTSTSTNFTFTVVQTVQVIVTTSAPQLSFSVNSTGYTVTQDLTVAVGSTLTLSTPPLQNSPIGGSQCVWTDWSDGGAVTHDVIISGPETFTANFALTAPQESAHKGGQVPGETAGVLFKRFGTPAVYGSRVVVQGYFAQPGEASQNGLFDGVSLQELHRSGETAPGITSGKFSSFSLPALNGNGMAFVALASAPGKGTEAGVWSDALGALTLLGVAGGPVPEISGAKFNAFSSVALPETGGAIFVAKMRHGFGGVSASNDTGLWRETASGVKLLIRTGQKLSIGGGGTLRTIRTFTAIPGVPGSQSQRRSFTSDGTVYVRVSFTDGSSGILELPPTNAPAIVDALTTDAPETLPTAAFSKFGIPAGGASNLAFEASLAVGHGGVTKATSLGIFTGAPGAAAPLVREGDGAPGVSGGFFSSFSDPGLSENGALAFLGHLKTGGGITSAKATGLWSTATGSLHLAAQAGQLAPGAGTAKFKSFSSFIIPDTNASKGPLYLARLASGAGASGANNMGLWATDESNGGHLIVRTGDHLQVDGKTRTVLLIEVLNFAQYSPGKGNAVGAGGLVAYRLVFTDLSDAIYTAYLP